MAKKANTSTKRLQIDKANVNIVVVMAVGSFLVVFSIFASLSLLSQRSYEAKVIKAKTTAVNQLKSNITAAQNLASSYKDFESTSENVIGGNPNGTGANDGDNAKIVLDALPSTYDFPALVSSINALLTNNNYNIQSITGTDQEISQQNTASPNPAPIQIPFHLTVVGSYSSIKALTDTLQKSIRPFQIQSMDIVGNDAALTTTINAVTYYLPQKNLSITSEVIK